MRQRGDEAFSTAGSQNHSRMSTLGSMSARGCLGLAWLAACLAWVLGVRVEGITPFSTANPDAYRRSPIALGGGGWDWTGKFGPFTGVPVGPSSFLTASHIGQSPGQFFTWRGQSFRAVASESDPQSDLCIWHISGEFPGFAPRVTSDLREGDGVVILGRGTSRGTQVLVDRGFGPELAGWQWGANDGVLRWGTNTVDSLEDGSVVGLYGPVALFDFDGDAGDDECSVSVGDSGGPAWVSRAGEWQLAAITFATESEFRTTEAGPTLRGTLFDFRGLYRRAGGDQWGLEPPDSDGPVPATVISTRVWPRRQWIDGVIQRAPGAASLLAAPALDGVFSPAAGVTHDLVRREFRIAMGVGSMFFRVTGPAGPLLRDIRVEGSRVVIRYD